jgi:hypothetical protein
VEADEIIFAGDEASSRLSRMVERGALRRLGPGVYSTNLDDPAEEVCRSNWLPITANFCPGAVIADRSARTGQPGPDGELFVVAQRVRAVRLPGLTIHPRPGPGPQHDDMAYPNGLWMSSRARGLLENQRQSRSVKGRVARTLSERELADWIDSLVRGLSEEKIGEILGRIRALAPEFNLPEEGNRAERMIGAALQTQEVQTSSPLLSARQSGVPYDSAREALFDRLHDALHASAPLTIVAWDEDAERRETLPFWDAYFSNFIEGTEFTVDEAIGIVYENRIPGGRPLDAHDIADTYRVVADDSEMSLRPSTFAEFEEMLLRRHRLIMSARPSVRPGEYKESPNRAGTTFFVEPELVRGTLLRGWDRLARLASPAHRAFFAMFLVSEVHPFADGNGRTARIMMNAEFHAAGEARAIIPIVYRNEYLDALRRLSRQADPELLIRVLQFARRYTAAIDFSNLDVSRQQLEATNAFLTPDEALTRGRYLTIPTAADTRSPEGGVETEQQAARDAQHEAIPRNEGPVPVKADRTTKATPHRAHARRRPR